MVVAFFAAFNSPASQPWALPHQPASKPSRDQRGLGTFLLLFDEVLAMGEFRHLGRLDTTKSRATSAAAAAYATAGSAMRRPACIKRNAGDAATTDVATSGNASPIAAIEITAASPWLATRSGRNGFSLVELLVVIAIIGTLVSLLLPAVQSAREATRRSACQNNLKQLGLAMHNFESGRRYYPPAGSTTGMAIGKAPWSCQALVLPFMEEGNVFSKIDFSKPYGEQDTTVFPSGSVATIRVDVLLCPSDRNNRPRLNRTTGAQEHYPLSYGTNNGHFLIYNPSTKTAGSGAFALNSRFRNGLFSDGLSKTLAMAEVKAFTPRYQDTSQPASSQVPTTPGEVRSMLGGGSWDHEFGHTEWVCGRAIHSGFTTTFPPNTAVPEQRDGQTYDIDVTTVRENATASTTTYAVVTSRSYHAGVVNAAMMDGSVRSFASETDAAVWAALGSRAGGEAGSAWE